MKGKILLLVIVCIAAGFVYLHTHNLIPQIFPFASELQNKVTTFMRENILALPLIGGLCSALAGLAVKKVTTKTQESLQANLDVANIANVQNEEYITKMEQELEAYKTQFGGDVVGKVQDLTTHLNEAQDTINTQKDQLDISIQRARNLEAERNHLQDQLKEAQNQIDILEGRVKPPIK